MNGAEAFSVHLPRSGQAVATIDQLLASSAKDRFVSHLSHHLRTPLTAILGFSDLLMGNLPRREDNIDLYAAEINKAGKELLDLIDDVLLYSNLVKHSKSFEVAEVDLLVALNRAVALNQHIAREREISVSLIVPKRQAYVMGDYECILQAIGQLVENAVRYAPAGSTIRIRLIHNAASGFISIYILNSSALPTLLPAVAFGSGDPYCARPGQGVGIGLHLTSHIMGALGGTLRVRVFQDCRVAAALGFKSTRPAANHLFA